MPELYSTTNLIINNIPSEISDEQLNKLFRSFGAIKSYKIIRGSDRDSKAFGFCEYNDSKSAKQALLQLDNYRLNDLLLKVSYAKLFPKPKGKCIEVLSLPKCTQEDMVRKYFSQFGRIARLRLLLNNENGIRSTEANLTKIAEIVYENKADAEKACVQNIIKWNYDNGKQAVVTVSLIGSDKLKNYDRDSLSIDNKSLINSNILYINSNPKQLGDQNNYFFQFNNTINGGQGHVEQTFNTNSLFDFSNLNNIVNCTSLMPLYHHHRNPAATAAAFQFANNLQATAEFYSAQHFNNVAIQIPQHPQSQYVTGNQYEVNDNKSNTINNNVVMGSSNPTIPVQYHHGQNPFAAIYPNYNSFIQTPNPLPMGIPLIYTALTNNYPVKTATYEKSSIINQIKPDFLYPKNNCTGTNNVIISNSNINNKFMSKNSYVLYVYNIGNSTTKEQLKDLFGPKFGKEIIKVDVPKDSQNGSNKNFGFVTFGNYQKAQLAIQEMNGKEFQGKPLQVSFKK